MPDHDLQPSTCWHPRAPTPRPPDTSHFLVLSHRLQQRPSTSYSSQDLHLKHSSTCTRHPATRITTSLHFSQTMPRPPVNLPSSFRLQVWHTPLMTGPRILRGHLEDWQVPPDFLQPDNHLPDRRPRPDICTPSTHSHYMSSPWLHRTTSRFFNFTLLRFHFQLHSPQLHVQQLLQPSSDAFAGLSTAECRCPCWGLYDCV
jgi:hypothetical protein